MIFHPRRIYSAAIISLFGIFGLSFSNSFASAIVTKQLAPGIAFTQETTPSLLINIVTADRNAPGVRIESAIAKDSITNGSGDPNQGRDLVRVTARRRRALMAINGDFFGYTGDPLGFGMTGGDIYSEPWTTPRAAFGLIPGCKQALFDVLSYRGDLISKSGSCQVSAIDRPITKASRNDVVLYTQLYGALSGGRPGCAEALVNQVNLPISPNKTLSGIVGSVKPNISSPSHILDDSVVISASPSGKGYQFLTSLRLEAR